MNRLAAVYGFPVTRGYRFRLSGTKYRLRSVGVRALKLLADILAHQPDRRDAYWLIPYREHAREIQRLNPTASLTWVIDRTDYDELRRLAIWLRGRCGGTLGAKTVARFRSSEDAALRKDVTRCLHRLSAWAELRQIADNDPSPRIRKMATQARAKPFAGRLTAFARHVPRRKVAARPAQLLVTAGLDVDQPSPPKAGWQLRAILERIQQLVRSSRR